MPTATTASSRSARHNVTRIGTNGMYSSAMPTVDAPSANSPHHARDEPPRLRRQPADGGANRCVYRPGGAHDADDPAGDEDEEDDVLRRGQARRNGGQKGERRQRLGVHRAPRAGDDAAAVPLELSGRQDVARELRGHDQHEDEDECVRDAASFHGPYPPRRRPPTNAKARTNETCRARPQPAGSAGRVVGNAYQQLAEVLAPQQAEERRYPPGPALPRRPPGT